MTKERFKKELRGGLFTDISVYMERDDIGSDKGGDTYNISLMQVHLFKRFGGIWARDISKTQASGTSSVNQFGQHGCVGQNGLFL